ncbi:MAG: hypothetical protein IID13_05890 [Candidatus Marinimicrobia bacterium]|nr:hypothetical protein [Candidatus Neomarinimicrobiota bacterium]
MIEKAARKWTLFRQGVGKLSLATFVLGLAFGLFGRSCLHQPIYIEQRASKLVIFNNTTDTLNFTIMQRRAARFMKWKPCDHPVQCGGRGIPPGRNGSMPYELIYQWYPGAEVVVYWWHLVPDAGAANGYRVDGPHEEFSNTPLKAIFGSDRSWDTG